MWIGVFGLCAAGAASSAPESPDVSANVPVEQLQFYRNPDGLVFANAWGDPATGPHSNYIRLSGRTASPPHIHSSSYYGVVIYGIVSNERRGQPDRPQRTGSYWYQTGGEPHVTKCLSPANCLIFVTSRGRFDIHPVDDLPTVSGSADSRK